VVAAQAAAALSAASTAASASLASQSATSVIFLPVEGSKTSTRFLVALSTHFPPIQRSVGIGKGLGPVLGAGIVKLLVIGFSYGLSLGMKSGGKRGAVAAKGGAGNRLQSVDIQLAGIVVDQPGGADGGFRRPVLLVF